MLPLSTRHPVRYTPESCRDEPAAPVYLVAVASVFGRAEFNALLVEHGLVSPSDDEARAALIDGIKAVVEEGQQQDLIDVIEQVAEHDGGPLPDHLDKLYDQIDRQVRPHYRPYGRLVAARTRFFSLMPILACRFFLRGVENADFGLEFRGGQLTDESLDRLPEGHAEAVGWKAWSLMSLLREQEKNSESPSPSPDTPESSREAASRPKTPKAGTSRARSTPKTRNSG